MLTKISEKFIGMDREISFNSETVGYELTPIKTDLNQGAAALG